MNLFIQRTLLTIIFFVFPFSGAFYSQASTEECETPSIIEVDKQPALKLIDEMFNNKVEICFDKTELEKDLSILTAFNRFRREESSAFVSSSCFNPLKLNNRNHDDLKRIAAFFRKDGKYYMGISEIEPRSYVVDFIKKNEKEDNNNDSIDPARMTLYPMAGALISGSLYPGQGDKRLHVIAGAGIHAVTTTAAIKFSRNSNLSSRQKKIFVENAGPVAGLLIGVLKEILYDSRHRDKHTVDPRDAVATALGAGFIPKLSISFDF